MYKTKIRNYLRHDNRNQNTIPQYRNQSRVDNCCKTNLSTTKRPTIFIKSSIYFMTIIPIEFIETFKRMLRKFFRPEF